MSIGDRIFNKVFSKQIQGLQERFQGSDFINALMRYINKLPIYMADNPEKYINEGYLFNPTVYTLVSFITQKAGAIPWGVYEVRDEKSLLSYKSVTPGLSNFKKEAIKKKALVALPSHDLNALFIRPNVLQSWSEFVEQSCGFKLITGNTYIHCLGPEGGANAGKVKEMNVLPSQYVSIKVGNAIQPILAYEMQGDRTVSIPPEQIIHLKYWSPNYTNGQFLYGESPIRSARRVVTRSNSSYDASVSLFQNMGAPGILSSASDASPFTPDQADELEKRYKKKVGTKRAGLPLMTGARLQWQQTGMSPVDLAIIESDKMDLRTLCGVYHLAPELFGDSANKTYSNMKEAGSAAYTNAVIPVLSSLRDGINAFIRGRYTEKIYIDFDTSMVSELQEDIQSLSSALAQCWWITGNEKRELLGFGVDESNPMMDEYLIPAGLFPPNEVTTTQIEEVAKRFSIDDYRTT